jgi:hypothetical protein
MNFSSIDLITIFVVFIIISIVIFEMIEIVDDLNMNDIDVLLKKYDRAQTKLIRSDFDAHNQNRVQEKIQIYVNVFSFSFFISARFIRVALSFINFRISRISTKRRFKILIVSKINEFSRDSRDVMNDDDDEKFNVNDDNRSNYIRCCRILIDCHRVANIVCDKNVLNKRLRVFQYVVNSCVNDSLFNFRKFWFVFVSSFINCRTLKLLFALTRYQRKHL